MTGPSAAAEARVGCDAMFLLLLGCADPPAADSPPVAQTDDDADGWTVEEGDCDDDAPPVHPGAAEVCNGIDEDCDTVIDEACGGDTQAE